MKTKNYIQAPLPFQGQKRRFLNEFKLALNHFKSAPMFVDLFGGSGLLAHTVKQMYPDADVVYNDYDDYHLRLANIERTNALLAQFRVILVNEPADKVVSKEGKERILKAIQKEEKITGYVDYITQLLSQLRSNSIDQPMNLHEIAL